MSGINLAELEKDYDLVRANPGLMQRAINQRLRQFRNGEYELVDPSNPVVLTMEAALTASSNFMTRNAINTRRQYPAAAQTEEDVYLHMSDIDYPGRFALPSSAKLEIVMRKAEVINKMVDDPETGYRKLVIPRNAYIEVDETRFNFEYPLEIRQLPHGGLQMVWNTDQVSPLQNLTTNIVEWQEETQTQDNYLKITVPLIQTRVDVSNESIRLGQAFKMTIPLEDSYYHARVYVSNNQGGWTEIRTTHTDQVYDIENWTAVLKVIDGTVQVTIPQIYTNQDPQGRNVRVHVYTTKGEMNKPLSGLTPDKFTIVWTPLDKKDSTIYVAPLATLDTLLAFSTDIATGGRAALPFEELRRRVIMNTIGPAAIPISNARIEQTLIDKGYDIVKNIDNITDRVYLATRRLPVPSNSSLITSASCSIQLGLFKMEDLAKLGTVIDNGTSMTITPDTIFSNDTGQLKFVPKNQVDAILALSPERQALTVTSNNFYWTPWHYVLDRTATEFEARAYYLRNPVIQNKLFKSLNTKTQLNVNVDGFDIELTPNGYRILIATKSDDAWKALLDSERYVQLAFTPVGERELCYINGVLESTDPNSKEQVFSFDLSTNWNVTAGNGLELTKFKMFIDEPRIFAASLTSAMSVIFSTNHQMPVTWQPSAVDELIGRFILPPNMVGVTHEVLNVEFGQSLKNLWTRARSYASDMTYQTWPDDVPRVYEEDIAEQFPDGSTIKIENGQIVRNIIHHKGDPVLDDNGDPTYIARKGDYKLDSYGNPIPTDPRGMYRQVDFMLVEGAYWFATDSVAQAYRQEMTDILVKWITEDIPTVTPVLMEKTRIYFYPKTTTGTFDVMFGEGIVTKIQAGQSFRVDISVTEEVHNNEILKEQLKRKTVKTISEQIAGDRISMSKVSRVVGDMLGSDILDIRITGLGGASNFPIVTIIDDTNRCSVRKRLVAQPDNTLIVEEDITFNFVRHSLRTD